MLLRTGIIAFALAGISAVSGCGDGNGGPPDTASLEKLEVPGRVEAVFEKYCWPFAWRDPYASSRPLIIGGSEHYVQWSPDGSQILFDASRNWPEEPADLYSVEIDGSRLEKIVDTKARNPVWGDGSGTIYFDISPDGSRIAYSTCAFTKVGRILGGDEWQYSYEIVMSNIDGTDVRRLTENKRADTFPEWSPDGSRIAYLSNVDYKTQLIVHTLATGESREVVLPFANLSYQTPIRWSPDGERIAFVQSIQNPSLYTVKVDGSDLAKIADAASGPAWAPDGQRIAVAVPKAEHDQIEERVALYAFAPDGSDPASVEHNLPKPWKIRGNPWMGDLSWSPDGSEILLDGFAFRVSLDGLYPDQPLLLAEQFVAAWSPDGTKIAIRVEDYSSTSIGETGPFLYILDRDGTNPRVLVKVVDEEEPGKAPRIMLAPKPASSAADPSLCSDGFIVLEENFSPGLIEDCETLLNIKAKVISLDIPLNWSPFLAIDAWDGVFLGGTPVRVHQLLLGRTGLTGALPPELGNLTELKRLSIRRNYLGGKIPPEVGNLGSLESLQLDRNFLTGPIPPELGRLDSLRELDLSYNRLSGNIPAEMAGLANLEKIDLSANDQLGCVPTELPILWLANGGLENCPE